MELYISTQHLSLPHVLVHELHRHRRTVRTLQARDPQQHSLPRSLARATLHFHRPVRLEDVDAKHILTEPFDHPFQRIAVHAHRRVLRRIPHPDHRPRVRSHAFAREDEHARPISEIARLTKRLAHARETQTRRHRATRRALLDRERGVARTIAVSVRTSTHV